MKSHHAIALTFALALAPALAPAQEAEEASVSLDTQEAKVSYALGMQLGKNLQSQDVSIDASLYALGLEHGLAGGETLLSENEVRDVMTSFQKEMQQKFAEKQQREAVANEEEGAAFLASNKEKEGVQTTDSGLQYEVLKAGDSEQKPTASDTVSVHYTGKLTDGTVFDSSVDRGEPATFPLGGVIPGWTEGLQLMTVGSKYRFVIPPELAYGPRGAPPRIGPGAVLDFEVELLEIVSGGQPAGSGSK